MNSINKSFRYFGTLAVFLLLTIGIFFIARYPIDRDSLKVYFHAGTNIFELLQTLDYYKKEEDIRKYRAAKFLIRNMDLHPHYEDPYSDKKMEWLLNYPGLTRGGIKRIDDSLEIAWAELKLELRPRKIRDSRVITSELLISHIDKAFQIWDESPWKDHFQFAQFCEYFLPYKTDESEPELWWDHYREKYADLLPDTFVSAGLPELIQLIYDDVHSNLGWHHIDLRRHLTSVEKDEIFSGACRFRSDFYGHIFRSQGMPVANIYCPDEANTVGSLHFWNAWRDPDGKWHEIVERHEVVRDLEILPPKVFLRPWGKQDSSLRSIASKNNLSLADIPQELQPWNIVDITEQIVPASDVTVKINRELPVNTKFVFLATYETRDWKPVYWTTMNEPEVTFDQMATNALYLPVFFKAGQCIQAGDIFVLYDSGEVTRFDPDTSEFKEVILDRVYPIRHYLMDRHLQRMHYSTFEGSMNVDFSVTDTLYRMPPYGEYKVVPPQDNAMMGRWTLDHFWQDIVLEKPVIYKYIRYKARKTIPFRIGELEVYDNLNRKVVPDTIFSNMERPERISDGIYGWDFADEEPGSWVVLDLGIPTQISRLRFLPNDIHPASIQEGDEYQLSIWDEDNWKHIYKIRAKDKGIACELYQGGLYLLENLSREVYARPFSYNFQQNLVEWW